MLFRSLAILVALWLQPNRLAHTKLVVRNRFIQASDTNNPSLRKQETIFVSVNNPHHSASTTLVIRNGFIQASDKNNQLPQPTTSVSVNNPQHPASPTTSQQPLHRQTTNTTSSNQTTNVTTTSPQQQPSTTCASVNNQQPTTPPPDLSEDRCRVPTPATGHFEIPPQMNSTVHATV